MIARHSVRRLLPALLACVPAAPLQAQEIAFPGIPWGTPVETVRARLEAGGYTIEHAFDSGDLLFLRGDSAWLEVDLRDGRAVGFVLWDPAAPAEVDSRYAAVMDSLRAARGDPDEAGKDLARTNAWVHGLASLELSLDRTRGARRVALAWYGPGWYDEMARRRDDPPLPAGFTIVGATTFLRIAIDTTLWGGQRGRFRLEYYQPITPTVDGVAQDPIDGVEYEMDVDCARGRTRLVSRTTLLEGRRLGSHRPQGQPWTVPQPDGHYARGRDALCRARRAGDGGTG